MEPESEEDEDTIIERRRQLRQAIVQKYQLQAPGTPQEATSSTALASETESNSAENIIEAELEEEGRRLEEEGGEETSELRKEEDPKEMKKREEELKKTKTDLSALRAAVRNGDMFSEEDHLFTELQLVSLWCGSPYTGVSVCGVHLTLCNTVSVFVVWCT